MTTVVIFILLANAGFKTWIFGKALRHALETSH
jgi:hypothetical protein